MSVDVLAIAAHPDDLELAVGGTLAKLSDQGRKVAIIDLTRGEMATRGTPEIRAREAEAAASVLGVEERINLDLGDGTLQDTHAHRARVIEHIRRLRPKIVLANYWDDLHPDHAATGQIVMNTMYPTGFAQYPAPGEPYRPHEYLFFMAHFTVDPSFIVDITDYQQKKLEAMRCYASQLHNPDSTEPTTQIAQPQFLQRVEARSRHYGSLIQRPLGEPFVTRRPVPMDDPVAHYEPFAK